MKSRLLQACRLAMVLAVAVPGPAAAQWADELVVAADEPLGVFIGSAYLSLAPTTATVDHILLNHDVVQALRLVPRRQDRSANLAIGGRIALYGRHGPAAVGMSDAWVWQELFWFPNTSLLPAQGTIGPFALPHQMVTVRWGTGNVQLHAWPLMGGIDRAAYGIVQLGKTFFALGADVRTRRRLPVASAATGADLAELLGGRLVGEPWLEEVMLGLRRPVRRLELDKPLVLGPMRFAAVAVRVGRSGDGTSQLPPGQKPVPDAERDPAETLVRGRTAVNRPVTRMLLLSRNHLEEQGCISLTVAKVQRAFVLGCSDPPAAIAPAATGPVPLRPAEAPGDAAGPADDGWLELAADAPLAARIIDQPVTLLLRSGGLAAITLNNSVAARLALEQPGAAGDDSGGGGNVPAAAPPAGTRIGVSLVGRNGTARLRWRSDDSAGDVLAADGTIDAAVLPYQKVRLRLPVETAAATPLVLRILQGNRGRAIGGVVDQPLRRPFLMLAEVGERTGLPLVSAALAADLADDLGGHMQGPAWDEHPGSGTARRLRRLVLQVPWRIGPLRFTAVAVEVAPHAEGSRRRNRPTRLPTAAAVKPVRQLWLSRTQLEEQRCGALAIDAVNGQWSLWCAGPAMTEEGA